jgi:hypothetical protein
MLFSSEIETDMSCGQNSIVYNNNCPAGLLGSLSLFKYKQTAIQPATFFTMPIWFYPQRLGAIVMEPESPTELLIIAHNTCPPSICIEVCVGTPLDKKITPVHEVLNLAIQFSCSVLQLMPLAAALYNNTFSVAAGLHLFSCQFLVNM